MEKVHRQLGTAIGTITVFLIIFMWYLTGFLYPGPRLIGIAGMITVVTELIMFVSSLMDFRKIGVNKQTIALSIISLFSMLGSGYVFLIWSMTVAA